MKKSPRHAKSACRPPFSKGVALKKEISVLLVVKLVFIFMIWVLFFQHPIAERLTSQDIAHHVAN